jgi:hypothetical protein
MKIVGLAEQNNRPEDFVVKMVITFGPGFHLGKLSRGEFVSKLRKAAKERKGTFLEKMFEHHADHIEQAAKVFPEGKYALESPAILEEILNVYGGDGSCPDCSEPPGVSCCSCEHDGVTSCEGCSA